MARTDSAQALVELRGTPTDFAFVAPPLNRDGPAALQRMRIARSPAGALVLHAVSTRKIDADASGRQLAGWTTTRLLDRVATLSIDYYGVPPLGGAPRWQDRWWDRPQPPELVRIRIGFESGSRRDWPDLVVAPRATINAGCAAEGPFNRCEDGA